MLSEKNIIYGFCNATNPQKKKYLISLHRNQDINIIACFTTSKSRTGSYFGKEHGVIKDSKGFNISYCFKKEKVVEKKPTGEEFSFPRDTVVVFDYGFQEGEQNDILDKFEDPEITCTLTDEEYYELIYVMYKSPYIRKDYVSIFEKKLELLR